MIEKREMARFKLRLQARIQMGDAAHGVMILNMVTKNICSGGSFLQTDHRLPLGSHISIELVLNLLKHDEKLQRKSLIHTSGRVCRLENTGMAIAFDEQYKISRSEAPGTETDNKRR